MDESPAIAPAWQTHLCGAQLAASQGNFSSFVKSVQVFLYAFGNHPFALLDLAALLIQVGELSRAEDLLHWIHQLVPTHQVSLINLAGLWLQTLRHAQAFALYEQLGITSNLLMALGYQNKRSASTARQMALRWAYELPAARHVFQHPRQVAPSVPLRLGFLSADFCQHPVGLFLLPLVEQLRSQYPQLQLVFYDNSPRSDWLTLRLRLCGLWRTVQFLNLEQLGSLIESDGLWGLIDLGGHTAGNRLPVLQLKPAPRQFSWLGYWATTGFTDVLDAVLVDPLVVPPGSLEERSFVEPIRRFPQSRWCYRPVPWMPEPQDPPCLTRGFVTFGSFNNAAKFNLPLLICWAALLNAVPGSRLLLRNYQFKDVGFQKVVTELFAAQGVSPSSLELQGPCFHADLLAAYSQVDIALDPFPFNGGLTSCEALWLGLPLVTLAAEDHAAVMAARQGLAMLHLIGRPEWIATSEAEYVAIAAELAADHKALHHIRHHQRAHIMASPLCDERGFANAFLDVLGVFEA